MKRIAFLLLAVGFLALAGAAPPADATRADREALQGAWKLESFESDGRVLTVEDLRMGRMVFLARLVIAGEKYSFALGDSRLELTCKLDAGKTPKEIDLTVMEGGYKGKVFRGIYRLEGDTYTVCRGLDPGMERPRAFAAGPGSNFMIAVWKREKPSGGKGG